MPRAAGRGMQAAPRGTRGALHHWVGRPFCVPAIDPTDTVTRVGLHLAVLRGS